MEDATLAKYVDNNGQNDLLFAVFDGHGGPEIAIFSKIAFPTILEWNMKYFIEKDKDYIKTSLKKSIRDLDRIL